METENANKNSYSLGCNLRVLALPVIVHFLALIVCTGLLMSFVPRQLEGMRSVPTVSWQAYALIGNFLPLVSSLIVLALLHRNSRQRLVAWMVAGLLCYFAHEMFLTYLLRRDFIGKF
jgi:hypothetical protein